MEENPLYEKLLDHLGKREKLDLRLTNGHLSVIPTSHKYGTEQRFCGKLNKQEQCFNHFL